MTPPPKPKFDLQVYQRTRDRQIYQDPKTCSESKQAILDKYETTKNKTI